MLNSMKPIYQNNIFCICNHIVTGALQTTSIVQNHQYTKINSQVNLQYLLEMSYNILRENILYIFIDHDFFDHTTNYLVAK